ncbi:MAG: thioredoxin [Proteobacteria bacterium]|nr:thioredoxin [Pseudomonadota bacterium]
MAFILNAGEPRPVAAPAAEVVKDGSEATFVKDVIEASVKTPVIVDFWAPWCGPCKQLGPMLEKVVRAGKGAVRMVKINVDENQGIAQQLRIQSIPAVYAFKNGRPVDGFVGALSEGQLKRFVERLVGGQVVSPAEEALEHAKALLEGGDTAGAMNLFARVLREEPANTAAAAGLVRCQIATGQLAQAAKVLDSLPAEIANHAEVAGARAALDLASQGQKSAGEKAAAERRLAENPNDHQARFDLALACSAAGDNEAAIVALTEIVRRDRAWNDEAARKQLLKIFEALGPTHPATVAGRRRLSSVLFS